MFKTRNMSQENLVAKAIAYLNSLESGINPYTGKHLDAEDFKDKRLSKLFQFVATTLSELENCSVSEKLAPCRAWFRAENVNVEKVKISETPVGVNTLARNICATFDTSEMQGISGAVIADWLVYKDYLKSERLDGKIRKSLGPKHAELGLSVTEGKNKETGERYLQILYPPQAQLFVVENLKAISVWNTKRRKNTRKE